MSATLGEDRTEAVRALAPDDPIPLPDGMLACWACGVAVPARAPVTVAVVPATGLGRPAPVAGRVQYGRCPSCVAVHSEAAAYVRERPVLAGRIGDVIASERIESVLFGLRVLAKPAPADLAFLLPRLHPPGHSIRFANRMTVTAGLCGPWAWSHVTTGQRGALRAAYADVLADRVALSQEPVRIACPSGGCKLCGIAAIERSAIEVRRRGGVTVTALAVWEQVGQGHACPDCAEVVQRVGAVGPTATEAAVLAHLKRTNVKAARRLRLMLNDDHGLPLIAWADAATNVPNSEPWSHLRRVLGRL